MQIFFKNIESLRLNIYEYKMIFSQENQVSKTRFLFCTNRVLKIRDLCGNFKSRSTSATRRDAIFLNL